MERGMPAVLLLGRQLQRWRYPPRPSGRNDAVRIARPGRAAPSLQAADGVELPVAVLGAKRFQLRLRRLCARSECRPISARDGASRSGPDGPSALQLHQETVRGGEPWAQRVRARERRCLPHLLMLCAGSGRVQRRQPAARPRDAWARRRLAPAAVHVDPPPRRVRRRGRRGGGSMTRSGSVQAQAAVVGGLLAAAGLAWWSTAVRMKGMNAAPGTDLGTVGWYTVTWAVMMASLAPAAAAATAARRHI